MQISHKGIYLVPVEPGQAPPRWKLYGQHRHSTTSPKSDGMATRMPSSPPKKRRLAHNWHKRPFSRENGPPRWRPVIVASCCKYWCRGPDSNRHEQLCPTDFKSVAYTNFATPAIHRTLDPPQPHTSSRARSEPSNGLRARPSPQERAQGASSERARMARENE